MKVALPVSGGFAEFRDSLMRGDVRDARKGMVFITQADGSRHTDGSFLDQITGRLISRMLVAWDVPGPLPRDAASDELAQQILDRLDEDDYGALEKAVGPWVEKLLRANRDTVFTHPSTGAKVTAVTPADGEKLAASPDFTAGEAGDPKAGPGRSAITSSPASTPGPGSPAPSGQEPS